MNTKTFKVKTYMKSNALTLPPDEVERRVFGTPLTDLNRHQPPLSAGAIEARNNLEKTRLAFEAQQQRKAMPDLKTELTKVINEWNAPEAPTTMTKTHFAVTNNVTRATFERIAQNPGITREALYQSMALDGFKRSSTTSLVAQMLAKGNIRLHGSGLFTAQAEYKALPRAQPTKPRKIKAIVQTAPKPEILPVVSTPPAWDTSDIIDRLNIKQARALYEELKSIFGV